MMREDASQAASYRSLDEIRRHFFPNRASDAEVESENPQRLGARLAREALCQMVQQRFAHESV